MFAAGCSDPAVSAPASTPEPKPATCHPDTKGGYGCEPGEYCRRSDHSAAGIAGDGTRITCIKKDGVWLWEPA